MKRSFYAELSGDNRSELDRRLIDGNYSEYQEIKAWLESEGCETSQTAIKTHAEKLRTKLEAMKLENNYRRAYGDEMASDIEAGAVSLIATAQRASQHLANVLERKMREYDESNIPIPQDLLSAATSLSKAVGAIAAINNTQLVARKYAAELKAKQEAKLSELASEGESRGIDAEFMRKIRTEILGIE